ncbi:MAG: ribulose-phosphate 3-epimerase [Candidatus Diapherotrites archaeon]
MDKIVASVLDADFSNWKTWLKAIENAGIKRIQWDIMDNKFVENNGVDKKYIQILRPKTKLFFESHLMVNYPENYINEFAENGTQLLIFHLESTKNPLNLIEKIEDHGLKVGMAIDINTDQKKIYPFLDKIDLALVMSVKAGKGGQKFQEKVLTKIKELKKEIQNNELQCEIEVDGGIKPETAKKCLNAGANLLVVGSYIFKNPIGINAALEELKKI